MSLNINELLATVHSLPNESDRLCQRASELPALRDSICALVQFAHALLPGLKFRQEGQRFVAFPQNFVAFTVRSARARHVTVELRGAPDEFAIDPVLPLRDARSGSYSSFHYNNPRQLAAAAAYIARAQRLFERGSKRRRMRAEVKEVATRRDLAGRVDDGTRRSLVPAEDGSGRLLPVPLTPA